MEIVEGATRKVILYPDVVHKHPRPENFAVGLNANVCERGISRKFPQFSARVLNTIDGVVNVQQRLKPLREHPKFGAYKDIADRCYRLGIVTEECRKYREFLINSGILDMTTFFEYFGGQWAHSCFKAVPGLVQYLRDTGAAHELFVDANYGVDGEGRIKLVDLGNEKLANLLQKMGTELFDLLNTSICGCNYPTRNELFTVLNNGSQTGNYQTNH